MKLFYNKSGHLEISLDKFEQEDIKYLRGHSSSELAAEDIFIIDWLDMENLDDKIACWGGPAFSNGKDVFYFDRYALENFLELLSNGETVTFNKVK